MMAGRMTIGCLVRHLPTGALGTIIDHFMWDENGGGFEVQFISPVSLSSWTTKKSSRVKGRHTAFELVSGV